MYNGAPVKEGGFEKGCDGDIRRGATESPVDWRKQAFPPRNSKGGMLEFACHLLEPLDGAFLLVCNTGDEGGNSLAPGLIQVDSVVGPVNDPP